MISQRTGKIIGCVGHDCEDCRQTAAEIEHLKTTQAINKKFIDANAALEAEVTRLRGIEAIAKEYGIDGFVEIEGIRKVR